MKTFNEWLFSENAINVHLSNGKIMRLRDVGSTVIVPLKGNVGDHFNPNETEEWESDRIWQFPAGTLIWDNVTNTIQKIVKIEKAPKRNTDFSIN